VDDPACRKLGSRFVPHPSGCDFFPSFPRQLAPFRCGTNGAVIDSRQAFVPHPSGCDFYAQLCEFLGKWPFLVTVGVSISQEIGFAMTTKHFDHDGRTRFVTFSTHQQLPILSDPELSSMVFGALEAVTREYRCTLLAWVIMPEHVHLVLSPPVDAALGQIIGEIKSRSAKAAHSILLRRRSPLLASLRVHRDGQSHFALWKKRCFDRNCRSDEEICQKVRYCHWNPVRRGLAHAPEDYLWSSARRWLS
jgi:putative transposase